MPCSFAHIMGLMKGSQNQRRKLVRPFATLRHSRNAQKGSSLTARPESPSQTLFPGRALSGRGPPIPQPSLYGVPAALTCVLMILPSLLASLPWNVTVLSHCARGASTF